jgi:diacylglycerol kinase (ATP)
MGWPGRVRCAINGVGAVFASQPSARVQAVGAIAVLALGIALGLSSAEWCAVVLAITIVLAAEALNTSIESLVDLASPEFHELAGRAKDVAAGAVLIAALGSVAVGLLVFVPHLWR